MAPTCKRDQGRVLGKARWQPCSPKQVPFHGKPLLSSSMQKAFNHLVRVQRPTEPVLPHGTSSLVTLLLYKLALCDFRNDNRDFHMGNSTLLWVPRDFVHKRSAEACDYPAFYYTLFSFSDALQRAGLNG